MISSKQNYTWIFKNHGFNGCLPWEAIIGTMTDTMEEMKKEKPILHSMNSNSSTSPTTAGLKGNYTPIVIGIAVVLLGIATGYVLNRQSTNVLPSGEKEIIQESNGEIKKGQIYGSADEKAFRDSAEGMLEKGGLDGEGSHKLIRPGGDSQTAYLTSSALNLDQFVGKKIKIWGETFKSNKAGWFMDVGRVEVLE